MFESFKYMFSDRNFYKKYMFLLFFIIISNLLINWSSVYSPIYNHGKTSPLYYILLIIGFIIMFVPYGYSMSVLRYTINKSDDSLPELNIFHNFLDGVKVVLSGFILIIALIIILFLFGKISMLFAGILGDVVSSVIVVLSLLMLFFISFFGISMCCRYVVKPSYLNFVNFKAAVEVINNNVKKYLKAYLKTLLLCILVYGISMIMAYYLTKVGYLGLVIYSVAVSVIWSYMIFVLANIFAKAVDTHKI